jgi:hypothetical protein
MSSEFGSTGYGGALGLLVDIIQPAECRSTRNQRPPLRLDLLLAEPPNPREIGLRDGRGPSI